MTINFKNIDYLKSGTARQQLAWEEITRYKVLELLKKYNPILTGTLPIGIDVPESDLDIICECKNHLEFKTYLSENFSNKKEFKVYSTKQNGIYSTIAEFKTDNFLFEIFGQNIPTEKQNAYRHMLIEKEILNERGIEFRNKIMELKHNGIKTEPAFAQLLGLTGDPYKALLKLEK